MTYSIEVEAGENVWKKTGKEPDTTKVGITEAKAISMSTGKRARLVGLFGAIIYDTKYGDRPPRSKSEDG